MRFPTPLYHTTKRIITLSTPIRRFGNYPTLKVTADKMNSEEPTKECQQQGKGPMKEMNPHSVFYRKFSKSFTKICLLSIGTYYTLTFLREKLEQDEKNEKLAL